MCIKNIYITDIDKYVAVSPNNSGNKRSKQHYVPQGWQCPRCGKINAPWVLSCDCHIKPERIS